MLLTDARMSRLRGDVITPLWCMGICASVMASAYRSHAPAVDNAHPHLLVLQCSASPCQPGQSLHDPGSETPVVMHMDSVNFTSWCRWRIWPRQSTLCLLTRVVVATPMDLNRLIHMSKPSTTVA